MMKQNPAIVVRHLSVGYGGREVLRDVSFEIRRGEIFMILGGSGSGKSTLLKTMIGLCPPLSGEILIDGRPAPRAGAFEDSGILRAFGVMYQSGALFGSLTLEENVSLPLEESTRLPRKARSLIARLKLQQVGLGNYADRLPSEISGGMQKRAAVARAMALDPRILFLDEPSSGLDPVTSGELDDLVVSLRRDLGITFVIASHDLASIRSIGDRAIVLDGGRIVAEGPPQMLSEAKEPPFVRSFFRREAAARAA